MLFLCLFNLSHITYSCLSQWVSYFQISFKIVVVRLAKCLVLFVSSWLAPFFRWSRKQYMKRGIWYQWSIFLLFLFFILQCKRYSSEQIVNTMDLSLPLTKALQWWSNIRVPQISNFLDSWLLCEKWNISYTKAMYHQLFACFELMK